MTLALPSDGSSRTSCKRTFATTLVTAGLVFLAIAEDAEAATYCGQFKDATAKTSSRFGRVRTQACLEVYRNSTRAFARTKVDKPAGCTGGVTPAGPGVVCPPKAASLWPEFLGFDIDVQHDGSGIKRCSWGANGGHALTFTCYSLWKPGLGLHRASAQACFDVKDDDSPGYCTENATFERTF